MKNLIKIVLLPLLSVFQLTMSMTETKDSDESRGRIECFYDLFPEIQIPILLYSVDNSDEVNNDNTFDKINKSYQRLKVLSLVSKRFRSLEKDLMNSYRDKLKILISRPIKEDEIDIFRQIVANRLYDCDETTSFRDIFGWLSTDTLKTLNCIKSIFIVLRLNDTDKVEQDILRKIWSQLKIDKSSLLHLAGKIGHVELAKYLLNPIIMNSFAIDINEKNINGQTPLIVVCVCPKKNHKSEIVQLLLDAGADPRITITNKKRGRFTGLPTISNVDSIESEEVANVTPPQEYNAGELAWKHKNMKAHMLIEEYLKKMKSSNSETN